MKEMNKEMDLNMAELEQVYGGTGCTTFGSCSFWAEGNRPDDDYIQYCQPGTSPDIYIP